MRLSIDGLESELLDGFMSISTSEAMSRKKGRAGALENQCGDKKTEPTDLANMYGHQAPVGINHKFIARHWGLGLPSRCISAERSGFLFLK